MANWNCWVPPSRQSFRYTVHRMVYEAKNGALGKGLVLHHECGTKGCINPDHLTPMTRAEHIRLHDHTLADRAGQYCKRGHDLSVRGKPNPLNPERWTICLECRREAESRRRSSSQIGQ